MLEQRKQVAVVFPLQMDPTRKDMATLEGQSLTQHQFKTMFSSQGILRGVFDYARKHNEWSLCFSENELGGIKRFLRQWRPDGMVAHVSTPGLCKALKRCGVPVVNISSYLPDTGFPNVIVDNIAIGAAAAGHFLDRGFARAAFVGYPSVRFSETRWQGFAEKLHAHGVATFNYPTDLNGGNSSYTPANKDLCRWLQSLPKPIGIFCCNDGLANCISDTCRALGIRVPDDAAILGADNTEVVCDLANPPLSSVRISRERIGYMAAEQLDRMMKGQSPAAQTTLLPPDGVAVRQSSDILAIEDGDLVAAMRFIREHAHEPIGVPDILRHVPVSRRLLEKKFQKFLQRTILDEIQRNHIERAKKILTTTDNNLNAVARQSGFNSAERLLNIFKQKVGITPGEFRKQWIAHR